MAVEYLEVRFPHADDVEPCIVVYAVLDTGELVLRDSVEIGPFPDWESLARRVMRQVVLDGRALLKHNR